MLDITSQRRASILRFQRRLRANRHAPTPMLRACPAVIKETVNCRMSSATAPQIAVGAPSSLSVISPGSGWRGHCCQ
jgi:hypothetical protein